MVELEIMMKEIFNWLWIFELCFFVELIVFEVNFEFLLDWDVVLEVWKGFWELYFVGFGLLFFGVVLFFSFCVVWIKCWKKGMILGNYFFVVCLMLMLFSIFRMLFFVLDLYELYIVLYFFVIVVRIIFVIGYFCLMFVLLLIYVVFFEVNKFRFIFCWL